MHFKLVPRSCTGLFSAWSEGDRRISHYTTAPRSPHVACLAKEKLQVMKRLVAQYPSWLPGLQIYFCCKSLSLCFLGVPWSWSHLDVLHISRMNSIRTSSVFINITFIINITHISRVTIIIIEIMHHHHHYHHCYYHYIFIIVNIMS